MAMAHLKKRSMQLAKVRPRGNLEKQQHRDLVTTLEEATTGPNISIPSPLKPPSPLPGSSSAPLASPTPKEKESRHSLQSKVNRIEHDPDI